MVQLNRRPWWGRHDATAPATAAPAWRASTNTTTTMTTCTHSRSHSHPLTLSLTLHCILSLWLRSHASVPSAHHPASRIICRGPALIPALLFLVLDSILPPIYTCITTINSSNQLITKYHHSDGPIPISFHLAHIAHTLILSNPQPPPISQPPLPSAADRRGAPKLGSHGRHGQPSSRPSPSPSPTSGQPCARPPTSSILPVLHLSV